MDELILPNSPHYTDPTGGIVHAWRPSHWYTNMYRIGSAQQLNDTGSSSPLVTPSSSSSSSTMAWRIDAGTDAGVWRAARIRASTTSILYLGNVSSTADCVSLAANATATPRRVIGFSYFHLTFADPLFQGACYGLCNVNDWTGQTHYKMMGVDSGRAPQAVGRILFNFSWVRSQTNSM